MKQMVVLFLFMLIPVWIPLLAVTFGAVADRVRKPVPPRKYGAHARAHATLEVASAQN